MSMINNLKKKHISVWGLWSNKKKTLIDGISSQLVTILCLFFLKGFVRKHPWMYLLAIHVLRCDYQLFSYNLLKDTFIKNSWCLLANAYRRRLPAKPFFKILINVLWILSFHLIKIRNIIMLIVYLSFWNFKKNK